MSDKAPGYMGMGESRYKAVLAILRDYDQNKRDAQLILERGRNLGDGQPKGTDVTDPTGNIAIKREKILEKVRAVDNALLFVPEEYRAVLWEWVKEGTPIRDIPCAEYIGNRTLYNYKRVWLKGIEELMGWKVD